VGGAAPPPDGGLLDDVDFAPVDFSDAILSDAAILALPQVRAVVTQNDGVCAKVRIKLDQDTVLTRTAFRATLELGNKVPDAPLTGVGFTLDVRDKNGQAAGDVFNVRVTELQGIGGIDGTGQIAASSTGTAQWTLIPRDTAALLQDTVYTIGGTISYVQNGTRFNVPVEAVPITVKPDAALYLKYFHQRDVFSDDPHTDPIEPAVPYALAVLVENRGAGAANNLRITSAQPEIVDNEKGLLIDFKVIASEVAGESLSPSLTANFGTIAPGGRKVATWLMTSTLQGLFTDYKATFEHLDGLGDPRISLLKEVEIHEMIRQIEALGVRSDGQPDFLVNDVPDLNDYPDTVHLSDGTTEPVTVVETATGGTVSASNLVVTLNASLGSGWAYLRVPDPGAGQFRLNRVVRSDGLVIPLEKNVWVSDRTFIGLGRRPIYENILHLVDSGSTGQYTLTYQAVAVDTTAPESQVSALNASSTAQIPMQWSGTDAGGIAFYDIYVGVDGATPTLWKARTSLTGAIYLGESGRTYAFYSVATDLAGNREAAPATPDATTTVSLFNDPPIFLAIPDQVVAEGSVWRYQTFVADNDGPFTYRLASGAPAGMTIDATGGMRWVTGENNGGEAYLVTVEVTDSGFPAATAMRTFSIQVAETNTAPTLAPVPPQSTNAGSPLIVRLSAADADFPAQALTFSLAGATPAGLALDSASGVLTWTPTGAQLGSHSVTARVRDSGVNPDALSSERTFTIAVASAASNSSPRALPLDRVFVPENAPPSLVDLASAFADAEDGVTGLSYRVSGNSNPGLFEAIAIDPVTRQLSLGFKANTAGVAALTLEAIDTGLLTTASVLEVRVTDDPYEMWLFKYFPPRELIDAAKQASSWGPTADPDLDTVANLFEWALLRDPTVADAAGLAVSLDSGRRPRLAFDRNALALSRVEFGLSVSPDLGAWQPLGAPLVIGANGATAGDGTQRQSVSATDPEPITASVVAGERRVVDDTAAADDQLGRSVAIHGTTAVFGVPNADAAGVDAGAAIVVAKDATSAEWNFVREVRAADARAGDNFGIAVSLDADTLAVGAHNTDDAGLSSGAVYLFERHAGDADQWDQIAKIVAPDAAAGDNFGFAVALHGDTLVVGAFNDDDFGASSGGAYVFSRNQGGANRWGAVRKLLPADGARGDTFGYSVAVDGEFAVVGSRWDDDRGSSSGSAYVFRRDQGGANQWGQMQKLIAGDGVAQDQFGHAVAIDGAKILVGAPFHDAVQEDGGAAYAFTLTGSDWTPADKLAPGTLGAGDRFGHALAIRGATAVVGARFDEVAGEGAGAAYVYRTADWSLIFTVRASDAAANQEFGATVGLADTFFAIGAPMHAPPAAAGAGYVYPLQPSAAARRVYRLELQQK
jgi:hypothetical protein